MPTYWVVHNGRNPRRAARHGRVVSDKVRARVLADYLIELKGQPHTIFRMELKWEETRDCGDTE